MEWNIVIHEESRYVEVVTRGDADLKGSLEMARSIPEVMKTHRTKKILIDHRCIDAISGSISDVYMRPRQLKEIGAVHSIKVAEVVKREHADFFNFLETVCVNQGFEFSTFTDKESAMKWLFEKEPAGPAV